MNSALAVREAVRSKIKAEKRPDLKIFGMVGGKYGYEVALEDFM